MNAFDLQIAFFNPPWRRLLLTAVLLVWTGIEVAGGSPFWTILVGALALWSVWSFFVIWKGPYAPPEA